MNILKFFFLNLIFLSSCKNNSPEIILFKDLYEIEKIDSIEVFNNRGPHILKDLKLHEFIVKLENLSIENSITSKTGAKGFKIYANKKEIYFSGQTLGDYVETNASDVMKNEEWIEKEWIYFKTSNLNLDNY